MNHFANAIAMLLDPHERAAVSPIHDDRRQLPQQVGIADATASRPKHQDCRAKDRDQPEIGSYGPL